MIKVEVPQQRIDEYWLQVGKAMTEEIGRYLKALDHLKGLNIDEDDDDFTLCKGMAVDIINLVADPKKELNEFAKGKYTIAIKKYLTDAKKIPDSVIDNMIKFLTFFTDNNGTELKGLLLCPPDGLLAKHSSLTTTYNISTGLEKKIFDMIFNFKECTRIVVPIKTFFRQKPELMLVCPYCNLHKVNYVAGEEGQTGEVHELDHFFEKKNHPVLSYTLFNLVPSDTYCNASYNKGQHTVTEKYHINPYKGGYVAALRIKPIEIGNVIQRFDLDVRVTRADDLYWQMFGDMGIIKDSSKSGNLNIFKIRARYNDDTVIRDGQRYYKMITDYARSRRRMIGFFARMGKDISAEAHKAWYEKIIPANFDQVHFHDYVNSKLYRDLHDYVFIRDRHWFNKDVKKLIDDYPLTD